MKKTLSLLDKNKRFFLLTLLVSIVYSAISVAIPTISGRLITSVVADSANRTRLLLHLSAHQPLSALLCRIG